MFEGLHSFFEGHKPHSTFSPPLSCQALFFETYPTPHPLYQTSNWLSNINPLQQTFFCPLSKPFSLTALSFSQSTLR